MGGVNRQLRTVLLGESSMRVDDFGGGGEGHNNPTERGTQAAGLLLEGGASGCRASPQGYRRGRRATRRRERVPEAPLGQMLRFDTPFRETPPYAPMD